VIALYIILGIFAFILFLLHLGVRLIFEFDEKFTFKIRVLCFTFDLTKPKKKKPKKEKKPKKKKKAKKKKAGKEKGAPEGEGESAKPKRSFSDIMGFVKLVAKAVKAFSKRSVRLIPVTLHYFKVVCASPDAGDTARQYGLVSAAAFDLLELLKRYSRFKYDPRDVYVYPDFTIEKPVYAAKVSMKVRAIYFINALVSAGIAALGHMSAERKKKRGEAQAKAKNEARIKAALARQEKMNAARAAKAGAVTDEKKPSDMKTNEHNDHNKDDTERKNK